MTWLPPVAHLPASQTFPVGTQGPTVRQRGMADALPGVFFETTATLARPLHVGRCQCSRKPAATCQVLGRECRLSQETSKAAANNVPVAACSCCKGLICWAGPVVRAGQVLGRCLNETGPLPIG
ncbi:hypothetical protein OEZ86_008417 [Tetradesmus obliquus]|nr:hypothetical protein OEZ86_008417 [Tetradesmus obliquus]